MPYAPFFHTLHDETQPIGTLGRGTHYSVLRAVIWHDAVLRPLPRAALLDFAVIWDEDHDERIIDAVLALYFAGLLSPVLFIGERKGTLSVLLQHDARTGRSKAALATYAKSVEDIAQRLEDPWTLTIDSVNDAEHSIINDDPVSVDLYLRNIHMLWKLGIKATKTVAP